MRERTPVIVSTDGTSALELVEFEGEYRIPDRMAFGLYYTVRSVPYGEMNRLVVVFGNLARHAQPSAFGLLNVQDSKTLFEILAETRIGEFLDEGGTLAQAPEGATPTEIPCLSDRLRQWEPPRSPASDDVVEEYVRARLFRAWTFEYESCVFSWPDFLRMSVNPTGFLRVARLGEGADWTLDKLSDYEFRLGGSRDLLNAERSRRKMSRPAPEVAAVNSQSSFVDESRLNELRAITSQKFDLRRLIALCEELNLCASVNSVHAIAMLTRAIIDHVPPIFAAKSFTEVANNYPGTKSFRDSMQHLSNSARKIADSHLHVQIRNREVLPTRVQVDFSRDLDVLLSEIVRIL